MRRQRPIFQSARDPDPAHAIGMHDEGLVTCDGIVAFGGAARLVVGGFVFGEVGSVVAGPLVLLLVPPDKFLALAPRLAVGTRRRAVIKDAAIGRPRVSPAVTVRPVRLTLVG